MHRRVPITEGCPWCHKRVYACVCVLCEMVFCPLSPLGVVPYGAWWRVPQTQTGARCGGGCHRARRGFPWYMAEGATILNECLSRMANGAPKP